MDMVGVQIIFQLRTPQPQPL
ncbi:uncharacterized protein G2W53_036122 [Senna tora]|uniref:Uncharacterized protein n=1 Tax=Senna tora TaxID=362788 RepID=A0A834SSX4_9FABA|nr:uncharacterized protein G2W53_036122 [Senna tora]